MRKMQIFFLELNRKQQQHIEQEKKKIKIHEY